MSSEKQQAANEAQRRYRLANPEKVRATIDAWAKANPDKVRAIKRRYTKKHQEKLKVYRDSWREKSREKARQSPPSWHAANKARLKEYETTHHLKSHYRLSRDRFDSMLAAGCAICGADISGKLASGRRIAHVDHDHGCCPDGNTCGRCVRGVLCHRHNVGLGRFRDSIQELQAAIRYLQDWEAKTKAIPGRDE